MKKSYIKLLLFMFIFILVFISNSIVFRFLNQDSLNILLFCLLILSKYLFGFEKDRHRYTKDIILEIIIILIAFFLIYYLSGIVIGFARVENYLTVKSIFKFIIPIIIYVILKEVLRYQLVMKASLSKKMLIFVCLFFVLMDNTIAFAAHSFVFNKEMFLVVAISLVPSITENILGIYLALHFGYWPGIFFFLVMKLYLYLLPIVPNPNEYLYSLINFLFPIFVMCRVRRWLLRDRTEAILERTFVSRRKLILYWSLVSLIVVVLVYLVSGYFRYYAVAIASGSMEKVISKGDIVIVDQRYKEIGKRDVIAYHYEGKVIVHRIYKIIDTNGEYFIYTKGDANSNYDEYKITKDMIIGVVKFKIPLLGYPTVLLNEKW